MVRLVQNPQMQLGSFDISTIEFDPKSRDEMPQVLRGLQHIYVNRPFRDEVFALLEKHILPKVDKKNGRPGMELWKIFVLGVLRLNLNWDYDRLQDEANNHLKVRQMLGHPDFFDKYYYEIQTLKDNISLLTPELLDEINQIVVRSGHVVLKKKEGEVLRGRCDSFVVETNVHFPTDINLLWDAMRKVIELIERLCAQRGLSTWRRSAYNIRHVKKLMRVAQNSKRAKAKKEDQKKNLHNRMVEAHQEYLEVSRHYLQKACVTLEGLKKGSLEIKEEILIASIEGFIAHAQRQLDQIDRRVIRGEEIPHDEKVFSIFEPHTEWVMKGKAGVPVELGLKVCIVEDQYQFILHHEVLEKKTDDQIAIDIVKETKKRFVDFNNCSFDKGFHSKENQQELREQLDVLTLPRKGKLSQAAKEIENSEAFYRARHQHSAVESAINALEVHGLDRCPDRGINGFKRYVGLAIVSRNIQRLGAILRMQEKEQERRRWNRQCNCDDSLFKQAA